eukprot:16094434-Heterocapsa_arctica.AAC.1
MGMHSQQPLVGIAQNPMVMVHQSMSDGSNQLVQWLEPPLAASQSLNQSGQDQELQSLPAIPLKGSEIIGPPDGIVKQELEFMLRKGDMVHDARFMCWEVMVSKIREW